MHQTLLTDVLGSFAEAEGFFRSMTYYSSTLPDNGQSHLAFRLSVEGRSNPVLLAWSGSPGEMLRTIMHASKLKAGKSDFVVSELPDSWNADAHSILTEASMGEPQGKNYLPTGVDVALAFDCPDMMGVFTYACNIGTVVKAELLYLPASIAFECLVSKCSGVHPSTPKADTQDLPPAANAEDLLSEFRDMFEDAWGKSGGGSQPLPSDLTDMLPALNDLLGQAIDSGVDVSESLRDIVDLWNRTAQTGPTPGEGKKKEHENKDAKDPLGELADQINDVFGGILGGGVGAADTPLGSLLTQVFGSYASPGVGQTETTQPAEAIGAFLNGIAGAINNAKGEQAIDPAGITQQVSEVVGSWLPWLEQEKGTQSSFMGSTPNLSLGDWESLLLGAQGFCMQLGAVGQSAVSGNVMSIPWGEVDWSTWIPRWTKDMPALSDMMAQVPSYADALQAYLSEGSLGLPVSRMLPKREALPFTNPEAMVRIGALPGLSDTTFDALLVELFQDVPGCQNLDASALKARGEEVNKSCQECAKNPEAFMMALCSSKPVCEACAESLELVEATLGQYRQECLSRYSQEQIEQRMNYIRGNCQGRYGSLDSMAKAVCSDCSLEGLCGEEKTPTWKYALIGAGVVIAGGLLIKAVKD